MTGKLPPTTMDRPPTPLTVEEVAALLGPGLPGSNRKTAEMARAIVLRYGTEPVHSFAEAATLLGVTRERVRQMEAMALRILAHPGRVETVLDAAGRETRLGAVLLGRRELAAAALAWREGADGPDR